MAHSAMENGKEEMEIGKRLRRQESADRSKLRRAKILSDGECPQQRQQAAALQRARKARPQNGHDFASRKGAKSRFTATNLPR